MTGRFFVRAMKKTPTSLMKAGGPDRSDHHSSSASNGAAPETASRFSRSRRR